MNAVCWFCGDPIDPEALDTRRGTHGWERKSQDPARRSGSDIALRTPVDGEYAHEHCIRRVRAGVAPLQESLL